MSFEIPPEYEPHISQIPGWATDVDRFRICFATTRQIAQRDDPLFTKQLYDGDIDTGEQIAPSPDPAVRKLAAQRAHLKVGGMTTIADSQAMGWLDAHLGQRMQLTLVLDQGEYDVALLKLRGKLRKWRKGDSPQHWRGGPFYTPGPGSYFVGGSRSAAIDFRNVGYSCAFYVRGVPPNTNETLTLKLSADVEVRVTAADE